MRTPTWALLGTGFVGSTIYMSYKNRLDNQLNHTLVEESIHLLENNDEVVELIGAPIMVESSMRNRADLGDNINNFTYYVSGPRGKLRVELASCARNLSGIGVNSKGKKVLKDLNNGQTIEQATSVSTEQSGSSSGWFGWISSSKPTSETASTIDSQNETHSLSSSIEKRLQKDAHGNYPIPSNIPEFNFNNYYIPDPELVKSEKEIYQMTENGQKLPQDAKFWNIEYMFAEADESVRIMVAPIPESEKTDQPVFFRETFSDLANEYTERRNSRRDFRKAQTEEEREELRKFRLKEMYKNIGYTRYYMLCGFFLIGASGYIMFRKNKRLPIANNIIHSKAKKTIQDSQVLRAVLGEKLLFPNQTIGAKIGNDASFQF